MKRIIWVVLGWMVLLTMAHAASFDCARALTKVEKLICTDSELSKLDERLDATYKIALQDKKQADTIRQTQKQWMKKRNDCSDAACLRQAYETRLHGLSSASNACNIEATIDVLADCIEKNIYDPCDDATGKFGLVKCYDGHIRVAERRIERATKQIAEKSEAAGVVKYGMKRDHAVEANNIYRNYVGEQCELLGELDSVDFESGENPSSCTLRLYRERAETLEKILSLMVEKNNQ